MTYETKMVKGQNGWKATTNYSLGMIEVDDCGQKKQGERVLRLSTSKSGFAKWASAFASVHTVVDTGHGYKTEMHAMGLGSKCGDYSRTVLKEQPPRVTEKVIKELHERALQHFPAIIAEAEAHYAAQSTSEKE